MKAWYAESPRTAKRRFFLKKKIIYLDEREREIERNEGKIGAIGRD